MAKFDKGAHQARYAELTAKANAIQAKAGPLRAARDKKVQAARKEEDALNAAIKKAEAGLFEIEQERAFLARGLSTIESGSGDALKKN